MDKYLNRPNDSQSTSFSEEDKCTRAKQAKLRKYDESYIEFGFIENSDGRPKCVICLKVLANEGMKPAKLKRHLITKHPEYASKPKDFFRRKSEEYTRQKTRMVNLATIPEKAHKASYLVALRIAKSKKPHTIGEELILPSAVEMCEVMLGSEAANKLKSIPLSNDTVKRRIELLSVDIQSQLLDRLFNCPFLHNETGLGSIG